MAPSRTRSPDRGRPDHRAAAIAIAAVDRLTHFDDEATTFAEALAREHANILLVAKESHNFYRLT